MVLLATNLLIPVGVVLFTVGYFRGRPGVSAPVGVGISGKECATSKSTVFDKVIFMMVDALRRSDSFHMPLPPRCRLLPTSPENHCLVTTGP